MTQLSIIRKNVIALLRKAGYSPIEAVNRWDKAYKPYIEQAAPNTTHILIVGEYQVEFIKTGGNQ